MEYNNTTRSHAFGLLVAPPRRHKGNTNMSEITTKPKSNAPWILGIIGVFLTILHYACAIVCAAATGAAKTGFSDRYTGEELMEANAAVEQSMSVANFSILVFGICFILSFFGKGKHSKLTGMILIVGGIVGSICSIAHFSFAGIAAGIVYMCAGISSICNSKKAAV